MRSIRLGNISKIKTTILIKSKELQILNLTYQILNQNIINNTLKIIKLNNIKKIQYFSSFAVYGKSTNCNEEKDIPKLDNDLRKIIDKTKKINDFKGKLIE